MPLRKTNKSQEAPKQTLDHFFNSTPNLPSQPKSHRTAKLNSNAKLPRSCSSSKAKEIIVIDSDSEEVEIVETRTTKRRKLTPKKSGNAAHRVKVDHSTTPGQSSSKENENTVLNESSIERLDTRVESVFGKPYLLLPTASSSQALEEVSTTTAFGDPSPLKSQPLATSTSSAECASFGEPFLLRPPSVAGGGSELPKPASHSHLSSSTTLEVKSEDVPSTLDDWENGDDERDADMPGEDDIDPEWPAEDVYQEGITHNFEATKHMSIDQSTSSVNNEHPAAPHASSSRSNAFSLLMTSFKEKEVWKEATVADDRSFRPMKSNGGRRHAPFYKVMQGMPIAVDAFKYGTIPGVTAYFLTHAHSDHYTNLSSKWKNGPIYCSEGTANLIIHMLSVDRKWVHPLPMDTPTVVPNTNGVTVTLIEANHCPGSCLFFFEGRQTVNAGDSTFKSSHVGSSKVFRYLHCGDFRASPAHILHPAVKGKVIDHVYLDTTYLDPKYTFPPQPLVISACADLAKRIVNGQSLKEKNSSSFLNWMKFGLDVKGKGKERPSKPLVVIGTYSIGKERIAKAVAIALNTKIYCDARKMAILRCQADPELHNLLTNNPEEGNVHLIPLSSISTDQLKLYLEKYKQTYDRIIGFRPTGWTYTQPAGTNQSPSISTILSASASSNYTFADLQLSPRSTQSLQLYPVPYSEHSSFHELTCFAMSFSWTKMIATVNVGSEKSRAKMARWMAKWETERKKRGKDQVVPHRHPDYW